MLFSSILIANTLLSFQQSGDIYTEESDGLGSADWIGEANVTTINGDLLFTAEIQEACDECSVEWRIGFTSNPLSSTPELLICSDGVDVWIENN